MKHAIILFFSFILFLSSKVWAQERLSLEGSWLALLDVASVRICISWENSTGFSKENIAGRPSTNQFKYSLLKYLNSRAFNPTEVIDPAIVQELLTKNN